ncbi:MAG: hypothetical protein WC405_02805 [Syntrophales bacterium]
MSETGASASYRGYRLQALYALRRMLSVDANASYVFRPEGFEDLDIEDHGNLIETIQVKSYKRLVLSDLTPAKENSFFHRSLDLIQLPEYPKVKLVNFGNFSEEMQLAWQGDERCRSIVTEKLENYGFDSKDIDLFFSSIELIALDEITEKDAFIEQLQNFLTGIDPDSAFDLLNHWLFIQSENRARISHADLLDRVRNVGRFLSERYHHHKEWFTTICPIEDHVIEEAVLPKLREEFFAGVSARYEHILADLDFRRESKVHEIVNACKNANVVILHAASGQGKTTLAYRYLHDVYPSKVRFSIQAIENRQSALSIALALEGYAKALQLPMAIFIDVSPLDTGWPELVKQLSRNKFFQILVSIREEDFRRTISSSSFDYNSVDLTFKKDEANWIYDRIRDAGYPLTHLTFESAWHAFGTNGPLMEFVYFLTQTRTLRQRLEDQVNRIRSEVREKNLSPDELAFLRLTAVATAYDAHVCLSDLITILNLPDPGLTLKFFENEYLLKTTPDNQYIVGLHPIRSRILAELLTEPSISPWITAVTEIIRFIPEADWEIFFMQALLDRQLEFKGITDLMIELAPTTWVGLAGVLRCLLWVGVKEYVVENWNVSEDARALFGSGWYFFVDYNFAGEEAPSIKGFWKNLGELIPEERQKQIEENIKKQTYKEQVFRHAKPWLVLQDGSSLQLSSELDWKAIAEVLYWAFRWGISDKFERALSDDTLRCPVRNATLDDLAEFSLGLHMANPPRHIKWIEAQRADIEERLARELKIIAFTEVESTLIVHYLTYPEDERQQDGEDERGKTLHDETVEKIKVIRKLFPNYEKYGSQGYGHQIPNLGFKHVDDTTKTGIPKDSLPPYWPIRLNSIAIGLVDYEHRLDCWNDYCDEVLRIRRLLVDCLAAISIGIAKYFQQDKPYNILKLAVFKTKKWDQCTNLISNMPLLPKPAVDGWGMARPNREISGNSSGIERYLPQSILNQTYKPYLKAESELFFSMKNFMNQMPDVIMASFLGGKLPEGSSQKAAVLRPLLEGKILKDNRRLSLFNLEQSKDNLSHYQLSFRGLLGRSFDGDAVTHIEASERAVIEMLWTLWYFFALYPRTATANPRKELPAQIDKIIQKQIDKFDDCVSIFSRDNGRIERLDADIFWEGFPAIWIQLDTHYSTDITEIIFDLVSTFRQTIGVIPLIDVRYRLIEENARYIVIVPTVRGKMINNFVWPLRTVFTVVNEDSFESRPWAYLPKELPSIIKDALDLSVWESETIIIVHQYASSVALLNVTLTMLSQIGRVPDATEHGKKLLQGFVAERSKELSRLVQTFLDQSTEFIGIFNSLSPEERNSRPHFAKAMEILSEVFAQIFPSDNFDKQESIDIKDLFRYAERVQKMIVPIEEVKLLLIDDAISMQCQNSI